MFFRITCFKVGKLIKPSNLNVSDIQVFLIIYYIFIMYPCIALLVSPSALSRLICFQWPIPESTFHFLLREQFSRSKKVLKLQAIFFSGHS